MKFLIFPILMLFCFQAHAQTTKTINNPYYEFKKSGIYNISKIELRPTETRVVLKTTFIPGWWVQFDKDEFLRDPDSGETFKITGMEGDLFNQHVYTQGSGDTTFVLTFPPLPEKVKRIDYCESVFGISLDKNLEGLKPTNMVSPDIEVWMNKEVAKCKKKPLKNFDSKNFFTEDTARIVGCITGYSPKSGIKTGIIYFSDYLTREDQPLVIEVQEDGRFEVAIPTFAPLYSQITLGNEWISFYIEPGQTLGMTIPWEEFLQANIFRDRNYRFKNIQFKGALSRTNYDLMSYVFENDVINNNRIRRKLKTQTFDEKQKYYNDLKELQIKKLDYHHSVWRPENQKAYTILKNAILLKHGKEMFRLVSTRRYQARKDTSNKELQKPLDDSFYAFLQNIPMDSKSIMVNSDFHYFINGFEYSDPIREHDQMQTKGIKTINFISYLLMDESKISEEDGAFIDLVMAEFKTDAEKDSLKKIYRTGYNKLIKNYPNSYKAWNNKNINTRTEVEFSKWESAKESLARDFKWGPDLTLDVAKTRSLKFMFENSPEDLCTKLWNGLKDGISEPYLVKKGDRLFDKYFGKDADKAYKLPDGKATDIFNKLIAPHKGKILLVDFWSTSCGPCVYAIKKSKAIRKEFADSQDIDFVFITEDRASSTKKYNTFVKEQELTNSYRIDKNDYLYLRQLFKFNGIPRYVLIDKEGKVIDNNFNARSLNLKTKLQETMEKHKH